MVVSKHKIVTLSLSCDAHWPPVGSRAVMLSDSCVDFGAI